MHRLLSSLFLNVGKCGDILVWVNLKHDKPLKTEMNCGGIESP